MNLEEKDLSELKRIYFKHYRIILTDEDALHVAKRLLNSVKIIIKEPYRGNLNDTK